MNSGLPSLVSADRISTQINQVRLSLQFTPEQIDPTTPEANLLLVVLISNMQVI